MRFIKVIILSYLISLFPAKAELNIDFDYTPTPIQFIASLGASNDNAGDGAETWGIWLDDPAQRAVWLKYYPLVRKMGGFTPANWQILEDDWWVDENGLIMQPPNFPISAGKYVVTGDREVTTILTVYEADAEGNMRWELGHDAALHEVTHLPCRSARYTPKGDAGSCLPSQIDQSVFPLPIGDALPSLESCNKQDYSVLIVVGRVQG